MLLDDAPPAASAAPQPAPPSDRPKVVIEDPHPAEPKNPLKPYLLGISILASLLLLGLIASSLYQQGRYKELDAQYQQKVSELGTKDVLMADLQGDFAAAQQEIETYKGDKDGLMAALVDTKQNLTDKMNELTSCQSMLLLAQGEIRRLQNLSATNCDAMVAEFKDDCNLAIEHLFRNATLACRDAVDFHPDFSGDDVKDIVEDQVDLSLFKFPS